MHCTMNRLMVRVGFAICLCLGFVATIGSVAGAQTPIFSIPEGGGTDFASPGSAPSFNGNPFEQPPTFELIPKSPNGPHGKVWVRSNNAGLVIWGRVEAADNSVRWPKEKTDMLASTHVEVWLAASTHVAMPEIGFGNQFGPEEFKTAADCSSSDSSTQRTDPQKISQCQQWFKQQLLYRAQLKRLFVRQWLVANTEKHSFEDYASTAYATLKTNLHADSLPTVLAPKVGDGFRSEMRETGRPEKANDAAGAARDTSAVTGYEFHLLIPYTAFPPTQQLTLRDLWLMVDVFNAADASHKMGAFSTTSAQREWGKPATFNHLRLEKPHGVQLSPCGYKLKEMDVYGTEYGAWYFPGVSDKDPRLITSDFALMNSATGYEYEPGSMSPLVQTFEHFSKKLADGSIVCGPNLAYVHGGARGESAFEIDSNSLASRRSSDGWLLLRSGPTMTSQNPNFGSGECGACPVEMMQMYAISPEGKIIKALDLNDRIASDPGDAAAVDYGFLNDWSRITYYTEYPDDPDDTSENPKTHANSVTYCLKNHKYEQCGKADKVPMPDPPKFKMPEEDN